MFDDVLMDDKIFDALNILSELWLWWGIGERYVSHIQKPLVL